MAKRSDASTGIGGLIFFIIVLIAIIPPPVWIALGIIVAAVIVTWIVVSIVEAVDKRREAAAERERAERVERARQARQRRIQILGKKNAALVESTLRAVKKIAASEAARAGWLGDVDFTADIRWVTAQFEKSHELRGVADKLSALNKPTVEDRRILAEAKTAIANLERAAIERLGLIEQCATEAQRIDDSLRSEREDARVAEQRAELHAKLSAMLYGVEAAPDTKPTDSAVDAVMARVAAFRELKNQIQLARDGAS